MTLQSYPTLFLVHGKAHKAQTQSQPCLELKMPTHNPPTPADEYLSSAIRHIDNISLLSAKAHPPPIRRSFNQPLISSFTYTHPFQQNIKHIDFFISGMENQIEELCLQQYCIN
jgi:hypothetical protein